MAFRDVPMMTGFFMVASFVMFSSRSMVMRSLFVVFRGLPMMLSALLGHLGNLRRIVQRGGLD
jgi:hypothetical protein